MLSALAVLACGDNPTSATARSGNQAQLKGVQTMRNLRGDLVPLSITPMYNKYDCFSTGYGTWYCPQVGTVAFGDYPYWFNDNGFGTVSWTGVSCTEDPEQCKWTSGGGSASEFPSRDLSTCDPTTNPLCERVLADSTRQKIASAIAQFVRDPNSIAEPAIRVRCQAMLDRYNQMANAGLVFEGAMDTPLDQPMWHYGAYNPNTRHIHFDPWALSALRPGNNASWQIANTALHEAAHDLGHNHEAAIMFKGHRGGTLLYEEEWFSDLNPSANSCLVP
ncbi:MAG: hypothetical protein H3C62_11560 [Gemmatimonadaceae bacterium]|nr:hypothetical protein [Gemmatimonadaceae bacterium]